MSRMYLLKAYGFFLLLAAGVTSIIMDRIYLDNTNTFRIQTVTKIFIVHSYSECKFKTRSYIILEYFDVKYSFKHVSLNTIYCLFLLCLFVSFLIYEYSFENMFSSVCGKIGQISCCLVPSFRLRCVVEKSILNILIYFISVLVYKILNSEDCIFFYKKEFAVAYI